MRVRALTPPPAGSSQMDAHGMRGGAVLVPPEACVALREEKVALAFEEAWREQNNAEMRLRCAFRSSRSITRVQQCLAEQTCRAHGSQATAPRAAEAPDVPVLL